MGSGICSPIGEAHADLTGKFGSAEAAAGTAGARLFWSGAHPFSSWRDPVPTESIRYANLLRRWRDIGHQLVIFGMHVHVGVASADAAIRACNGLAPLPSHATGSELQQPVAGSSGRFQPRISLLPWPARPRPEHGTAEVRVCDAPGRLFDGLAIALLVRRLIESAIERSGPGITGDQLPSGPSARDGPWANVGRTAAEWGSGGSRAPNDDSVTG